MEVINKVSDTLMKVKVAGEKPTVYNTGLLSLHLDRKLPKDVAGATVEEGSSSITLPQQNELLMAKDSTFMDIQVIIEKSFLNFSSFIL